MKAYLLRLAASVTRPTPALHPLVGSLFSGSLSPGSGQGEQAGAETRLDTPAAPAHAQGFPAATTLDPSAYSMRRDQGATHGVQERAEYAPLIERETFDPVFAHGAPDVRTAPDAAAQTFVNTTPGRFATPASALSQESGSRAPSSDIRNPEPPRIAPLVAGNMRQPVRPSGPDPLPPPIMAAAPTPRLPARDSPPARRRPPGPEPGDIQIHIGRIEVMAAPPAAPRPAAAPVRHAMSLDEYLKRRNGGSR
jgi:hypothetical protein